MVHIKKAAILAAILATSTSLWAQDPVERVVETIVSNNADLQSRRQTIEADRMQRSDENALSNPSVDFARVWGRHGIGNKLQLDVSQEFEWPGVYGARSRASSMAQSAATAEFDAAAVDVAMEARSLLIELVFVRKHIATINQLKNNFNKLSDAIDKGVRGGELTIIDQRKMEIENYEIDNDMAAALSRSMEIETALQAMSSAPLNLSEVAAYPVQPLLDRQQYLDKVAQEPQVTAQSLSADCEALNAKTASLSRMPGFSVGYQHQAEMGDRFNGFTVGVSLPVFQGRKARQAALERQNAAELTRDNIIARRSAEVNGTYSRLELYKSRIEAYDRTFGDNKYLDLLHKAYEGGQITVIDYLSEIHYYHQTILTYLEAEYNYNLALSELNRY